MKVELVNEQQAPINMEKQPSSEQTLWKLSDKRSHHVSSWMEQPSSTVHRNAKFCPCPSPFWQVNWEVCFCSRWPTLMKSLLPQKLLFLSQSLGGKVSPWHQSKSPCGSLSLAPQDLDLTATLFKQLSIWFTSPHSRTLTPLRGVGFYTF